jgi:hypothetical protein
MWRIRHTSFWEVAARFSRETSSCLGCFGKKVKMKKDSEEVSSFIGIQGGNESILGDQVLCMDSVAAALSFWRGGRTGRGFERGRLGRKFEVWRLCYCKF